MTEQEGAHYDGYYTDTGCILAPSCLHCPLPQCKHDLPQTSTKTLLRLVRDATVLVGMEEDDLSTDAAAERYGLTVRTIFRIKERDHKSRASGQR